MMKGHFCHIRKKKILKNLAFVNPNDKVVMTYKVTIYQIKS